MLFSPMLYFLKTSECLLLLVLMPSTLVAKASYTPIGDTGIPPKQILEQVIEGIPLFMENKYTEHNRFICSFIFAEFCQKRATSPVNLSESR